MKEIYFLLVLSLGLGLWTGKVEAARTGNENCSTENRGPSDCKERFDGVYKVTKHELGTGLDCKDVKKMGEKEWLKAGKHSHFRLVYEGEDARKGPLLTFRECQEDANNCASTPPKETNWEFNEKRGGSGGSWYYQSATATGTADACKIKIVFRKANLFAWGSNERAFLGNVSMFEYVNEGTTKAVKQFPCDISKVENLDKWIEYYRSNDRTKCVRREEIAGESKPSKYEDYVEPS